MKYIKFFLNTSTIILLATLAAMGSPVSIEVSQTTVPRGQSVTVTLKAQGKDITFPAIDHIGSYPIDTPRISQKVEAKYVNGKFSTLHEKSMQFVFFPDRNITLPAFTVTVDGKTEHTKPVAIRVVSASSNSQKSSDYHLEMIASRDRVYVGESFALQVIFFEPRNSHVTQAQYVAPKFDGFFVKADKQEKLRQDAQGTAHVFDYILTPQKEGNLTITAPQIKLGIQTFSGARDPWGFFNNDVKWQSLQAHPKTITVRPLPVAADLVGSFTIDARVDTRSARANQPVNYTLTIEGKGSLDDIDDPKFDLNGVTVYSDDAHVTSKIQNGSVISHWEKKYTFIADHDFTIPAIKQTAFDPQTGKTKTLTTQAFAIQIQGNPASQNKTAPLPSSSPSQPKNPPTTRATSTPTPHHPATENPESNRSLLEDTAYYAQQEKNKTPLSWWSLILAFVLGGVVVWIGQIVYARIRKKRPFVRPHRNYSIDEALHFLYPHTNDSPEIEAMVRELYRAKQDSGIKVDKERLGKLIEQVEDRR